MIDSGYRVILSSGYTIDISAMFVENLKAAIVDPELRWDPYLVNEDGPFVVPAHVVAIEILHDPSRVISAEAVSVATLDVADLNELTSPRSPEPL